MPIITTNYLIKKPFSKHQNTGSCYYLLCSQIGLWGSLFLERFLCMLPFFENPTIEVINPTIQEVIPFSWIVHTGCFCVHRLDLCLNTLIQEFLGNEDRTHVNYPPPETPRTEPTTLHHAGQQAQHTPIQLFRSLHFYNFVFKQNNPHSSLPWILFDKVKRAGCSSDQRVLTAYQISSKHPKLYETEAEVFVILASLWL